MLPNDPMLALRSAQDTMAQRQYESAQERLAATGPSLKRSIRPGTLFVTVVVALTALFGTTSAPVPDVAARRVLATSPRTLADLTTNRARLLAVDPAGTSQQLATRPRVVS